MKPARTYLWLDDLVHPSREPCRMKETVHAEYDSLERFRDYLLMVARGTIGVSYRGKVDAEELVNQALFAAFRSLDNFRGTTDGERIAWLRQILSGKVKDAIRHLHCDKRNIDREQGLPDADWDQSCSDFFAITCGMTSPSMKAEKHEQQLVLAAALARLPEQQRAAVELRHLNGCSLQETADALDTTVAAVAGLLRRGLKRLQELLQTETESQ